MARSKSSYSFKGVGETESKKIVSDPTLIRKTLSQLLGMHAPVAVIWIKDRSFVLKTRLSENTHPLKFLVLELVDGAEPQELLTALKKQGSTECYITLYTKSSSVIGVPTHFINVNADGYMFAIPEKIVKIDRRKEPRFKIPRGYRVDVSFELKAGVTENIQKRVYDISMNGLSFIVKKEELELYHSGMEIEQFSFRLRNRLMMCDVVVRNQVLIPSESTEQQSLTSKDSSEQEYKIGITFKNLEESHQEFIQNYIIENIIQYIQQS